MVIIDGCLKTHSFNSVQTKNVLFVASGLVSLVEAYEHGKKKMSGGNWVHITVVEWNRIRMF